MDQSPTKNPGTPLSAAALVIAILTLLGTPVILFISLGWADVTDGRDGAIGLTVGWMFFCSTSVLLGILGRKRSKASNHKGNLGTAAIVIGLLAELVCVWIVYCIFQVESII
jgi:hypothetical protein